MTESVAAALVTGLLSLMGVIISNLAAAKKTEASIRISQAVTEARLEELTREVREHNGFARRMPVVEEQLSGLRHRVEELERSTEI